MAAASSSSSSASKRTAEEEEEQDKQTKKQKRMTHKIENDELTAEIVAVYAARTEHIIKADNVDAFVTVLRNRNGSQLSSIFEGFCDLRLFILLIEHNATACAMKMIPYFKYNESDHVASLADVHLDMLLRPSHRELLRIVIFQRNTHLLWRKIEEEGKIVMVRHEEIVAQSICRLLVHAMKHDRGEEPLFLFALLDSIKQHNGTDIHRSAHFIRALLDNVPDFIARTRMGSDIYRAILELGHDDDLHDIFTNYANPNGWDGVGRKACYNLLRATSSRVSQRILSATVGQDGINPDVTNAIIMSYLTPAVTEHTPAGHDISYEQFVARE